MSANSVSNQKFRLKQVPIDVWSTREKLCLASSVQRSGDQNWSTVSRSLKAFAEQNRPKDWFNQKYCALQYQDLLEKIEKEIPKRKRGERGEEIAEDLIVRKLTNERIEELRKTTAVEKDLVKKLKSDFESFRNNTMDEKRINEIRNQMKDKEKAAKDAENEHKKWLEERDIKIAQMKAIRGPLQATRQKISTPATPSKTSLPSSSTTAETSSKSPLNEPLKVDIDSDISTSSQTQSTPQIEVNKSSLSVSIPTTSPLLTSLLQSPTPSTPTLLSPKKTGFSAPNFTHQTPANRVVSSPTPSTSITKRPSIHTSTEKVIPLNIPEKSDSTPDPIEVIQETKAEAIPQTSFQSSSLSQLLEIPTNETTKLPIDTNVEEANQVSEELENQTSEAKDVGITSATDDPRVGSPVRSPIKTSQSKQDLETSTRKEGTVKEIVIENVEKIDELILENTDKIEKVSDIEENVENDPIEAILIKKEIIESPVDEEPDKVITDNTVIKLEANDVSESTAEETKTPSTVATRAKRRKPATPLTQTITPTITRRSGRVKALRDSKTTTDDSTEVSDQSASNTPQDSKKRGSVDDTTETSMSEESMDAKIAVTAPLNESVPNSPASSIVQTEDSESIREYKIWKKAIMLVWRTASTHKNASLFIHPVTESEAQGYTDIVHRSMDLTSIKRRIENGIIRTTAEFQRDIMLMFQNAIMFNSAKHDVHKMAVEMQKETIASIEDFIETQNNQSNESKLRGRDRRSTAIASPLIADSETVRRKSRVASSDTDSCSTTLQKSAIKKKSLK